ncbi:MAG: GNAT family N-acetyltransferase [Patescibacteria group bacterium]
MATEISIRLVNESELEDTGRAYGASFSDSEFGEHWTELQAIALIRTCYRIQSDLFYIAVDGQKVVGGVAARIKPWYDGMRLADIELFVIPSHRRRGIAKQLVAALLSTAVDKYRVSTIETLTGKPGDFLHDYYLRHGFKPSGLSHIEANSADIIKKIV